MSRDVDVRHLINGVDVSAEHWQEVAKDAHERLRSGEITSMTPTASGLDGSTIPTMSLDCWQFKPCECGCGKFAYLGMLEAAHPEDYKYDERA